MRAASAAASGAAPRSTRVQATGSALLLIGSVALVGETSIQSVYTPEVLASVVVLAGVALAGLVLGGARMRPPVWAIVLSGLLAVRALAVAPPLDNVVSDDRLLTGVLVLAAVTVAPAVLPVVRTVHVGQVAAVAMAVAAAGYALVVLGGTPVIDVWVLLQGAGHGLADGRNPYELSFPESPPGQTDHCFTYLPATALLTAPGVWLGDARWAELVLLMSAGALLARALWLRGGARLGLATLLVVLPGTSYLVQQAWTETLLLPALVVTALLADRGRTAWAGVAFGVALATKQHVVLLVPLLLLCRFRVRDLAASAATAAALTLPWLLANPDRFLGCTAEFFLSADAPATSLSLWLHLPEPLRLPLVGAALIAGYLLAWRYCPRNGSGFLLGCATVFATFGLANKQTFLNQWWLVAALVVAGLALAGGRRSGPGGAPPGDTATEPRQARPPAGAADRAGEAADPQLPASPAPTAAPSGPAP